MTPSKYQQAVFNFIKNGKGNGVINAVAGSGKTTTIVNALKEVPKNADAIFLAFNKSIVNELQSRIPENVKASTLHSFGFSALMYNYKANKPKVEANKARNVLKELCKKWTDIDNKDMSDYVGRVLRLADLGRMNLTLDQESLIDLADKHGVDVVGSEFDRVIELTNILEQDNTQFDFTDMIYIPASRDIRIFQYDFVFIDECQDLNRAQQAMVKKMLKRNGRFIAVGDPKQAIYGFAGADAESFNNLKNTPNTIELPLSVSYRCGKAIIEKAKKIVPQIEAFENSGPGQVIESGKVENIKDGDMVLCRNTAPLVKMCWEFIGKGKKAFIKGSDIGKNLISLIERQRASNLKELFDGLQEELNLIVDRYMRQGMSIIEAQETNSYRLMSDKIESIYILSQGCKDPFCITEKIKKIFTDDSPGICLSTIHRAKGLESENVHIICPELLPSKYAKKEWQKVQESNLEYVAITRAKKILSYVRDWQFKR